jgi:hypothetical protein
MALSLLFLMWFLTGIGMIWSRGMPRLNAEMRIARMGPLDLAAVRLSPAEAAGGAGLLGRPPEVTLLTVMDRPAYRFEGRDMLTVFADTGELFSSLTLEEAIRIASRFLDVPGDKIAYDDLLADPDQWTLTLGRHLPMYRLKVDDGEGTEVYVSPREGEVVQFTTRRGRALAWVSVIPHFLYFRALRLDAGLWNGLMTWGAGLGVVVSLAGLLLGLMHLRGPASFRVRDLVSAIPFRGWLRWHYAAGLAFGLLTLTFVGSGLLSMEPWEWTRRDESLAAATREAFPGGAGELSDYPSPGEVDWSAIPGSGGIREIEFTRILGRPRLIARGGPSRAAAMGWPDGGHQPYFVERTRDAERVVVSATTFEVQEPVAREEIVSRLEAATGARVIEAARLDAYDSYYYSREARSPLPVLRLKLDDPDRTWIYVDPDVAQVVGRISRVNRVERWVYAGLHTFDFPFLYDRRPVWVALVVLVCLGGALVSGLGFVMGVRRIFGGLRGAGLPA